MGGNAHPSYPPPSRLTTDQHALVITTLTDFFIPLHCLTHLTSPNTAPEKQSHGDVDLLAVLHPSFPAQNLPLTLASAGLYDPRDHSYLYDLNGSSYQVDLTFVSEPSLPLELFLRSYGDVAAIVGAYARRLGYKLSGPKGLQVRLQLPLSGERISYELTSDVHEICEGYLGLDYERWQRGFEMDEALFGWLRVTAWYIRDEKKATKREREMFGRFQAWCCGLRECEEVPGLWERLEMVGRAEEARVWFEKEVRREGDVRALRRVCNGKVVNRYVRERYGVELKGSDLGEITKKVRSRLPEERVPTESEVFGIIDAIWASGEMVETS